MRWKFTKPNNLIIVEFNSELEFWSWALSQLQDSKKKNFLFNVSQKTVKHLREKTEDQTTGQSRGWDPMGKVGFQLKLKMFWFKLCMFLFII